MRSLLVAFGGLAWLGTIGATTTHAQTPRLEVSGALIQLRFAGTAVRPASLPLGAVQEPGARSAWCSAPSRRSAPRA